MTTTVDASTVSTAEELREQYDDPWTALADMHTKLDNQTTNIRGAFTKLGAIDDRIDGLETTAECNTECDTSEGECDTHVTDRNGSEANRNGCTDDRNADRNGSDQTPLETICALPEHIADDELSANQERARFIAADVHDYAKKVPAGLVIDSSTIRKKSSRPKREIVLTRKLSPVSWTFSTGLERTLSSWCNDGGRPRSCLMRRWPTAFITAVVIRTVGNPTLRA